MEPAALVARNPIWEPGDPCRESCSSVVGTRTHTVGHSRAGTVRADHSPSTDTGPHTGNHTACVWSDVTAHGTGCANNAANHGSPHHRPGCAGDAYSTTVYGTNGSANHRTGNAHSTANHGTHRSAHHGSGTGRTVHYTGPGTTGSDRTGRTAYRNTRRTGHRTRPGTGGYPANDNSRRRTGRGPSGAGHPADYRTGAPRRPPCLRFPEAARTGTDGRAAQPGALRARAARPGT
jgi:hypothetical protein